MRSLRTLVSGLPSTFWFLWVGTLVNRAGSFIYPFLALYLTGERQLPADRAALVVSLFGLGSFGAAMVGGRLADAIGRRATLLIALWGGAAAMLALGAARSLASIALGTFVLAFVQEMYRPAVSAIVSDIVPPKDRTRAFGLQYWAINFGFAVAPVVAGLMASQSYWWLFIGDAATTLIYGAIVLWKVPETRPPAPPQSARVRTSLADALAPFRDPVFGSFTATVFLVSLLFFQSQVALPLDMRAHGISDATYGRVIAMNGVLIILLQPFVTTWVQGYRRSRVLALAAFVLGAGFGIPAFVATLPAYVLSIVVWTLGEILMAGLSPSIVSDLAPTQLRGTYQGAFHMSFTLSSFVAPWASGLILQWYGSEALWLGCFAIGACGAAAHLAISGARRRRFDALRAEAVPVAALD